jgi:hypothetical protein
LRTAAVARPRTSTPAPGSVIPTERQGRDVAATAYSTSAATTTAVNPI